MKGRNTANARIRATQELRNLLKVESLLISIFKTKRQNARQAIPIKIKEVLNNSETSFVSVCITLRIISESIKIPYDDIKYTLKVALVIKSMDMNFVKYLIKIIFKRTKMRQK